MLIESLRILQGFQTTDFEFAQGVTLITSLGENSVGKTTLMRLLLYALGEAVPSTQGLRFSDLITRIAVRNDDGKILALVRHGQSLTVYGRERDDFTLPYDLPVVKSAVFGIDQELVLQNLVGCYYIDQDCGWRVFNRGKIIGDTRFRIEDLIHGLSGSDQSETKHQLESVKRELDKLNLAKSIVGYRDSLGNAPITDALRADSAGSDAKRFELLAQRSALKRSLDKIRKVQRQNEQFRNYVDGLKLRVRLGDGTNVLLTRDNLDEYGDNANYLKAQAAIIRAEIASLDRQIEDLEPITVQKALFDEGETEDPFDRQIAGLKLDAGVYDDQIRSLERKKKELEAQLASFSSEEKDILAFISSTAEKYCDRLGIGEAYRRDPKGVLTRSAGEKSGTVYNLMVLAFRLAYARVIEQRLGVKLPLLIDSPRGREMSSVNFSKCMALLREEFADYQVIIASIEAEGIAFDREIVLEGSLLSRQELVTDVAEWEQGLNLSAGQDADSLAATVTNRKSLFDNHLDDQETATVTAVALANLSVRQDAVGAMESVAKLERLYDKYPSNRRIARALARALANLSVRQDAVGAMESVAKLERLYDKHPGSRLFARALVAALVRARADLLARQDVGDATETSGRLESPHDKLLGSQ